MLVLSRKIGERVRVGGVWVEVVGVDGRTIKLGFTGPRSVEITREELLPAGSGPPRPGDAAPPGPPVE